MNEYLKPQTPIRNREDYIYPLTTIDQVIDFDSNERLNEVLNHRVPETRTINKKPLSQDVTLTAADVGAGTAPNENLLENWYLVDPINQRGKSSYSFTTAENVWYLRFGIDRYYAWANPTSQEVIPGVGVKFTGGTFSQHVTKDDPVLDLINGKTLTLSVLEADGTLRTITFVCSFTKETGFASPNIQGDGYIAKLQFFGGSTQSYQMIRFDVQAGHSATVAAFKLEIGDRQTLAYEKDGKWIVNLQGYDRNRELMKCKRYLTVFPSGALTGQPMSITANNISWVVPLDQQMWTTPQVVNITIDGQTGWTIHAVANSPFGVQVQCDKTAHGLAASSAISLRLKAGTNAMFTREV